MVANHFRSIHLQLYSKVGSRDVQQSDKFVSPMQSILHSYPPGLYCEFDIPIKVSKNISNSSITSASWCVSVSRGKDIYIISQFSCSYWNVHCCKQNMYVVSLHDHVAVWYIVRLPSFWLKMPNTLLAFSQCAAEVGWRQDYWTTISAPLKIAAWNKRRTRGVAIIII